MESSESRHRALGASNLLLALLLLGGIWVALPARWAPVDVGGTVLALLFAASGIGLFMGRTWGRKCALIVGAIGLATGLVLVTALAFTASYLSGLYGPVGGGGALLLLVMALLLLPYLVVFPAAQLAVLLGRRA